MFIGPRQIITKCLRIDGSVARTSQPINARRAYGTVYLCLLKSSNCFTLGCVLSLLLDKHLNMETWKQYVWVCVKLTAFGKLSSQSNRFRDRKNCWLKAIVLARNLSTWSSAWCSEMCGKLVKSSTTLYLTVFALFHIAFDGMSKAYIRLLFSIVSNKCTTLRVKGRHTVG